LTSNVIAEKFCGEDNGWSVVWQLYEIATGVDERNKAVPKLDVNYKGLAAFAKTAHKLYCKRKERLDRKVIMIPFSINDISHTT
jgi:hypothetical protein